MGKALSPVTDEKIAHVKSTFATAPLLLLLESHIFAFNLKVKALTLASAAHILNWNNSEKINTVPAQG